MDYTTYDSTSGEILGMISTIDLNHLKYYNYINGNFSSDDYYIVDGEAVEKPLLTSVVSWDKTTMVADGTDSCTISSLPDCVIVVRYQDDDLKPVINEPVTDGVLEVTADQPGIIEVRIESFPYKVYTIELEGT